MVHIERTTLLGGNAAKFKGGREYIHATDLIAELDYFARHLPGFPVFSLLELHRPLQTRGILHVETGLKLSTEHKFTATGHFMDTDGGNHPFVIFPSPMPILPSNRTFEEEALWSRCDLDLDTSQVTVIPTESLTLPEHVSSMMKLLCRRMFPHHQQWWCVRVTKSAPFPSHVNYLKLKVSRVIASRLVSAEIILNNKTLGRIEFVGGKR